MLCTLSLHIFKILSWLQKSLGEYFMFPLRCIYSIYIHSWVHSWHPFRKAFLLIAWKECLTELTHILHTTSGAVCWALKGFVRYLNFNSVPFSHDFITEHCQRIFNLVAHENPSTLHSAHFVSVSWLIWFDSTEMQNDTLKQSFTRKMTKRHKKSLFPYSTWQRHLVLWQKIVHVPRTRTDNTVFLSFRMFLNLLLNFLLSHVRLRPT